MGRTCTLRPELTHNASPGGHPGGGRADRVLGLCANIANYIRRRPALAHGTVADSNFIGNEQIGDCARRWPVGKPAGSDPPARHCPPSAGSNEDHDDAQLQAVPAVI